MPTGVGAIINMETYRTTVGNKSLNYDILVFFLVIICTWKV
jgi:hypothetical protein